MKYSFYYCIIQVLYITHNICDICDIFKFRTENCGQSQILVIKCHRLTCDDATCCYTYCDNFGFSVTYLVTFTFLVTVSAKLVTMLHRTNIRLLNWAVNSLHTVFVKFKENLPFNLWHVILWHMDNATCILVTLWHRRCNI